MAGGGRSSQEGGKRTRGRARPVRRSSGGGGGAQIIVGLVLAVTVFGIIYAVMKSSGGMGDRTYWNAYQITISKIRKSQNMGPDEIWDKVHALPSHEIKEPKLKELHEALIDYATVIRSAEDYTKRGTEVEDRLNQLEIEAARALGVQIIEK